jgi:hypothetical protein
MHGVVCTGVNWDSDYGPELAGAEATVRGDQGLAMAATRFVNFF